MCSHCTYSPIFFSFLYFFFSAKGISSHAGIKKRTLGTFFSFWYVCCVCIVLPLSRLLGGLVTLFRTAQKRLGTHCNRRYVGCLVLHCSSAVASCYLLLNLHSLDYQHRTCRAKGRQICGYREKRKDY